MSVVLPFLLVAAVLTLTGWGMTRLRKRVQRRRAGSSGMSGAMGVFDEIWHPAAHEPQIEIQQAYEREAPSPSANDDEGD